MLKKISSLSILVIISLQIQCQITNSQLWTDVTINRELSNKFSFDCEFSYRTILNSTDKWHSFNLIPKIEKSLSSHWDVLLYLGSINTLQQAKDNTWELRPSLGIRYRFTPVRKLQIRFLGRLEFRNQFTFESDLWTFDLRSRFRVEQTYFINGESFATNYLWYLLSDQEIFFTKDNDLQERFSSQILLRFGVGYKLSDYWRFESIFTYQYAKNTITGEFSSEDEGIIRLRFRYYFK